LAGVLVASPSYLKKCGVPKTPDDLHRHHIVMLRFASGLTVPWEFKLKGKAFNFETASPSIVISDTEGVGDAAVLGLGIARVSLHFAWPHLQSGRLNIVLNEFNEPGKREMSIQYPHRQHIAPRVKAFVDYAIDRLSRDTTLSATMKDATQFAA
jgi:DNA-binding transcriptional LysR family regulator